MKDLKQTTLQEEKMHELLFNYLKIEHIALDPNYRDLMRKICTVEKYSREHYQLIYDIFDRIFQNCTKDSERLAYLSQLRFNHKHYFDHELIGTMVSVIEIPFALLTYISLSISDIGDIFALVILIIAACIANGLKIYCRHTYKNKFMLEVTQMLEKMLDSYTKKTD